MSKSPETIKFVKRFPLNETFDQFDVWLRNIEEAIPDQEELDQAILECKEHYGAEFSEIFDEDKLTLLHENYLEWCLWEMNESLKYD